MVSDTTAPRANKLVERAIEIARNAHSSIRPVGSKFWHELDDFTQTVAIVAARDALSAQPTVDREAIAQIVARAYGGSLCPGLGVPGDYPTDREDYRAADAILALIHHIDDISEAKP